MSDDKLRVRREKAYTGIRTEDTGCMLGPLWKDGVWLEARDGKVGDLEQWMVRWLRDASEDCQRLADELKEPRICQLNADKWAAIAAAIARILKETDDLKREEPEPVAWGDRDLLERLKRDGYAEVQTNKAAATSPPVAVYTSPPAMERDHRAMEKLRANAVGERWTYSVTKDETCLLNWPDWVEEVHKKFGPANDPASAILATEGDESDE